MGTSAKHLTPIGVSTQSDCSGHEDCGTGKCNHKNKPWHLRQSRPGAHYEKKRRTSRIAKSRGRRPRPRSKASGPSRSARRRGTKS